MRGLSSTPHQLLTSLAWTAPHAPEPVRRPWGGEPELRHDDQPFRVLLYSHDSVGLGHIRRNLALAHALVADSQAFGGRPVTGILLTGVGHEAELDVPDGFDV